MVTDNPFIIYPAIDLRRGQVVRLMQGDPARQTTYGNDPAAAARRWLEAGSDWLHVVNLDGALDQDGGENRAALLAILTETGRVKPGARVQFGGGLRTLEDIESALEIGVERVMLGSMAVENPKYIIQAMDRFGSDRIGLAMDVRSGKVGIRGWQQETGVAPLEIGRQLYKSGLRVCAYTDIQRDGGGQGLNIDATQRFADVTGLSVIASGGVAELADVRAARDAGLSGAIIGRALYEGHIDLEEALAC